MSKTPTPTRPACPASRRSPNSLRPLQLAGDARLLETAFQNAQVRAAPLAESMQLCADGQRIFTRRRTAGTRPRSAPTSGRGRPITPCCWTKVDWLGPSSGAPSSRFVEADATMTEHHTSWARPCRPVGHDHAARGRRRGRTPAGHRRHPGTRSNVVAPWPTAGMGRRARGHRRPTQRVNATAGRGRNGTPPCDRRPRASDEGRPAARRGLARRADRCRFHTPRAQQPRLTPRINLEPTTSPGTPNCRPVNGRPISAHRAERVSRPIGPRSREALEAPGSPTYHAHPSATGRPGRRGPVDVETLVHRAELRGPVRSAGVQSEQDVERVSRTLHVGACHRDRDGSPLRDDRSRLYHNVRSRFGSEGGVGARLSSTSIRPTSSLLTVRKERINAG